MGAIFTQSDFSGGLNTQLDATKIPRNAYPLLINGRVRENVVTPTMRHLRIDGPVGNYQGVYVFGSFLLVFISGLAYYGDITDDPIILRHVGSWVAMDATVPRIYAEQVPATSNLFNKQGLPNTMVDIFNNSLAIFEQAVICCDGTNPPQAVLPSAAVSSLGSYATWTKDRPLYVPIGRLPAFSGAKLYLIAPDFHRIYHSVSGRATDFVVNLDANGDKGGDVNTVSQTVSFNPITALRALATGEVLVGTLYGTFLIELDYTRTIFGEPYLRPRVLFPAGPVNELSIIDVLQDTAFITQSGIHAFNAVAQAKRESNNFPFGAPIRRLLTDPNTKKAIIQADTCAGLYDDYAFFGVNTIYGFGAMVYDTASQAFHALDLSFGRVKQFATTRVSGSERMFFITADNQLFEAFVGPARNVTRILLGDWVPDTASKQSLSYMLDTVFTSVQGSGQVKLSFYTDSELRASTVLDIDGSTEDITLPIPIPFPALQPSQRAGMHMDGHKRAWKCSTMIEWNFAGNLAAMNIDGKIEDGDNVTGEIAIVNEPERFAFLADSGYSVELNTGGAFDAEELVIVSVTKGARYIYFANGNGDLVNGEEKITQGVFTAAGDTVAIQGTGAKTFSLKAAENYLSVLDAIDANTNLSAVLHGGDFAYEAGTELEVRMAKFPLRREFLFAPGNHDTGTDKGKYFFNLMQTPRFHYRDFRHASFFFFNTVTAKEPKGVNSASVQAAIVKDWLEKSTRTFNFLVAHEPPYTSDLNHSPGRTDLRYLLEYPKLSGILSGHAHNMELFVLNNFPIFISGVGGHSLRGFVAAPVTASQFADSSHFGYIYINIDAVTARFEFRDTTQAVLKAYEVYA